MRPIDVIILAAGRGSRSGEVKQYAELCGTPVIVHALRPFESLSYIGRKYIAVHPDHVELASQLLTRYRVSDFQLVIGGETRQESICRALEQVRTERVLTHNAAQPFITPELVDKVVDEPYPCVTTVTPLQISVCHGSEFAERIVDREKLQIINTPQIFQTEIYRDCHRRALGEGLKVASDCELMLHYGHPVRFVSGPPENFKLTTHLDMLLAQAIAQQMLRDQR